MKRKDNICQEGAVSYVHPESLLGYQVRKLRPACQFIPVPIACRAGIHHKKRQGKHPLPARLSEAEHFFIYRLQLETDVAKIKTILPKKYLSEIYTLPEYHCFYSDNTGIVKPLAPIRI
ncbi:MAG TPA: hypothetical protein VKL21_09135 [Candidatus Methanoperedens sp.]|nr:hypothetical protein [Candidatus Methanoperedens sp.]